MCAEAANPKYKKLLEPGYIGKLRLKNRIIKTAAGTGLIGDDGNVTDTMIHFYETLARGGVGLLIFEFCTVEWPRGGLRLTATSHFEDDKYMPGYARLVEAVHRYDCPFFIQLMHSGPWWAPGQIEEPGDRIGPSTLTRAELPGPAYTPPREMSLAEIEALIETFGKAAERAKRAGFDGVEINGSHHHLVNTFFSRFWNRRHDEYGCDSVENRARFICNIVRQCKQMCGRDYPITALINGAEFGTETGSTVEESKRLAQLLQEAGADAIQVRPAGYGAFDAVLHADRFFYPELPKKLMVGELDWTQHGRAVTLPLGAAIKQAVSVPVYLACRLDPELGEAALRAGKLDFIGMTRRLFADPELPRKIAEGREDDIVPCSGCNYCWDVRSFKNLPVRCRINAALGKGRDFEITPTGKKKRVLVAGGGLAGMEAARVAALRGHEVILYEKEPRLGGSLRVAAMVKDHELDDILETIRYFEIQLKKLGVKVRLGKALHKAAVDEIKPDVLILAGGGLPAVPDIHGIDNRKVIDAAKLHRQVKSYLRFFGPKALARLTRLYMPVGKRVVIIGGALQGCQLAEFLTKRGRKVTIVDTAEALGEGMLADDPAFLFAWFKEKGVVTMPQVKYEKITDAGLEVATRDGQRRTLPADTIIISLPFRPDAGMMEKMKGKAPEVYQVGDGREPGYMPDAVADGSVVGRKI